MKILKQYENVLAAMDNYVREDRMIYASRGTGKETEMTVAFRSPGSDVTAQLPVVLPSADILKQEEDFKTIKFNPMAESYLSRNQSEIQKRLVHDASAAVMIRMVQLFQALAYAAVDKDGHENLDPKIFDLLRGVKAPKDKAGIEKALKYVTNVLNKHKGIKGPNALCRYQQKANVKDGDKMYLRTTTLITPFLQKLDKEQPAGVKPPNKATGKLVQVIAANLMEELGIVSTWDGRDAPYFMSLLEAHGEIVNRMNVIAKALGVDLGPNFVNNFWTSKSEKQFVDNYNKELKIRFPGNEGTMVEEASAESTVVVEEQAPTPSAPAKPKAQATSVDVSPANTSLVRPAEDHVVKTPEPVNAPIDLEKRPMAIKSRTELQNPMDAAAPGYQSGFAGKSSATASPAQQTVAPAPVPAQPNSAPSGLVVEEAPKATSASLVVEEQLVHFHDANNRPLYRRNGQPYMIPAHEVPQEKYLQATDNNGSLKFNGEGTPVLRKAVPAGAAGAPIQPNGMPAASFYNGTNVPQPTATNPSSFYSQMDASRPQNFGHSTALATGVPMGQQQQPGQIMVRDQYGNQVPAQFNQQGQAMGVYYASNGQQITHYSQIAHLMQPQQQPMNQYNMVPQNNQPVSGFSFGTSNNAHF